MSCPVEGLQRVGKIKIGGCGGSIPVLTDPALLQPQVSAPSYRKLSTGTDLKYPPREQADDFTGFVESWITGEVYSNLRNKSESLAVKYGGDADLIAPVHILKKIFMTPYSKSRVSITVQRIGQTIILKPGFDFDAKELINRPKCDSENEDLTNYWFLNFAMHSRRIEGCECSPEQIGEPSGVSGRSGSNEFSRVLECQLDKFRMRLGSDQILFRNGKNEAVSLHLSDLSQQVPPLTWLEAWLDNVMANVPELAICYHEAGIVRGYEHLKTDDLFLRKGISGDAPAFDPRLVQQNGLSVLSFLQLHCKEDPGVYWLYKSAYEDEIQLFDLSKNPTERFNLLNQAVLVHEQSARRILGEEKSDLDNDLVHQAPATTTRPISMKLAAVNHVYQALKSLTLTRELHSSEHEKELDSKMWSLFLLLGESYISLGEAYSDCGALRSALDSVNLACSIYGSMPHKFEETLFVSAVYESFALQVSVEKLEQLFKKISQGVEQLDALEAESVPSFTSFRGLSSLCIFWAKAWLLVGHIYAQLHVIIHGSAEGTSTNQLSEIVKGKELAPNLPCELAEELKRFEEKLPACSKRCEACSLVSCRCDPKSKKIIKKLSGKGGIFKYLEFSMKDDAESNLLAALDCFEEAQRALQGLPSGCREIQSVLEMKAAIWNEIGMSRLMRKMFKEAETACGHAITAYKEAGDLTSAIVINCNMGTIRRRQAESIESTMLPTQKKAAHGQALEATTEEYVKSIKFYKAAETDLKLAIEKGIVVPERLKVDVYGNMGGAYTKLGMFLSKENTVAKAAYGLKSVVEDPSHGLCQLSATEALVEAIAVFEKNGLKRGMTSAYDRLGEYHKDRCVESERQGRHEEAKEQALLADENWRKLSVILCTEKWHDDFVTVLIKRSDFCNLPWLKDYMLESNLSTLLEGRHIPETNELTLANVLDRLQKVLMRLLIKTKEAPNHEKVRELYRKSLKAASGKITQELSEMHSLWTSGA